MIPWYIGDSPPPSHPTHRKEGIKFERNWLVWLKAAGIRAVRTFAEAALAYIGTGAMVLGDANWLGVLSAGAFGAITALLLALSGLPEEEIK